MEKKSIAIPVQGVRLGSELALPRNAKGAVLFSHGRGSGLLSARNRYVAHALQQKGLATLLVDLLTREEDAESEQPSDVTLLTQRLLSVTRWAMNYTPLAGLNIGLFGCSTGAASALKAAAKLGPGAVKAVVSAGGRPDLAGDVLSRVRSPTLLVVGGLDVMVLQLNKAALTELNCTKKLQVISGASHLFEEEVTLATATGHASQWFLKYLYRVPMEIEKDFMR